MGSYFTLSTAPCWCPKVGQMDLEEMASLIIEMFGDCQVRVYSSRGSGQVWMEMDEGEGQRLDKGLVQPELGPIGFNDKGIEC